MNHSKRHVAIISGAPLSRAPYLQYYITLLKRNNIPYIILNIEGNDNPINENQFVFKCDHKPGLKLKVIKNIKGFIFLATKLFRYRCSKLIVCPTRTGIKLLPLLRFYKDNYIFDIRDYTLEWNSKYAKKEQSVIRYSHFTFISSKGFYEWINPSPKIFVTHNIPAFYHESIDVKERVKTVVIGSVGIVSYKTENILLIKALGNNPSFLIEYYGEYSREEWNAQDFIEIQKSFNNVCFYGPYNNQEKDKIYMHINLINSLYGTSSVNTCTLTPNRLYDAAIYKIPIIVSKGSWMACLVDQYSLGIIVDLLTDNVEQCIEAYYNNFSSEKFIFGCNKFLSDVLSEQSTNDQMVLKFMRRF